MAGAANGTMTIHWQPLFGYGLVNAIQSMVYWRWLNAFARCGNAFPLVGHSHDVGKHAGGSYVGSCTIALDEHGVFAVAFRGE